MDIKIYTSKHFFLKTLFIIYISLFSTNLVAGVKNILVLNSYHQGLLWSDNVIQGIKKTLHNSDSNINLYIEHMDTKRNLPNTSFKYLQELYTQKYKNTPLDLIITIDNNALSFVVNKHLFHKTPVVFCGINNFENSLLGNKKNITGIVENIDIEGTIKLSKQLIPNLTKILFINDQTSTGKANKKKLLEVLDQKNNKLVFEYIDNIEKQDLIQKIKTLDNNTAIILFTFHTDAKATWFSIHEYLEFITSNSSVPVFSMWDNYMNQGIIGGVIINGENHGKQTASYILKILDGQDIQTIPIQLKSPNLTILDEKQLKKFNIDPLHISENIQIINQEKTLYQQYETFIHITIIFILILILLIIFLINYTQKLKRFKDQDLKYENLIENLPGIAYRCLYEQNWTMTYISSKCNFLTGYDRSELINNKVTSYKSIIHHDDKDYVWKNITSQINHNNQFELEYRIVTRTNEIKWVWEQGIAVRDNENNILYLEGVVLDINSKKLIEHRYKNLFNNAEVSIWNEDFSKLLQEINKLKQNGITNPHRYFKQNKEHAIKLLQTLSIVNVNKATLKMFKAKSEEDLITNIDKTFTNKSLLVFIKELCYIWEGKEYFYEETPFKTLEGEEISAIISFRIPKEEEEFSSIPISMVETTKLRQTQNELDFKASHLKTLINTIPDLIWLKNKDGVYLGCNHRFELFFGAKESKIIGKTDYDFVDKKLADFFREHDKKAMYSDKALLNEEEVVFANDGHKEILETIKTPMYDSHGKLIGVLGIARDITDRKKAEKELLEKEEIMLIQSRHAAMGEMISMIAHQWRQPLSVISMHANNILADIELDIIDTKTLKKTASDTIFQTQELSHTIDDFRNFFRPVKVAENTSIEEVFDETLKVIGKSLENNQVKTNISFNSKQPIKTYSRELMQVLINILKNAKEAMVERGISDDLKIINIKTTQKDNIVTISICDNGGGIEETILQKIFEPYFSTKNEKTGTGLGLYMSKTIIEKHLKGKIEAFNHENGACFKITITDLDSIEEVSY